MPRRIKILTRPYCAPSAMLLRNTIEAITGYRMIVTKRAAAIRGRFIRYGNPDPVTVRDTAFNSAAFIKLVANKAPFAALMAQHGIHSPVYHGQGTALPTLFPVLIRKTLTGSGGSGIVVCLDQASFNQHWAQNPGHWVWTPFVKTSFELRIHVLGGQVAKVMKKRRTEATPETKYPIRNLAHGYHYSARDPAKYPNLAPLMAQLKPILPGNMYTLDIGWDKAAQRYFVFEANSGSGLNSQTVQQYAHFLLDELGAL